jgi:hypothetical protein
MKRFELCQGRVLLAALLALMSGAVAAQDVTAQAMKLYEKHLYEDASRLLRPQLAAMDSQSLPSAQLSLGMIHLRSAELYAELQRNALVIETDYLKKLASQKGADTSRYVDFYLGQALVEDAKYSEGARHLQRFLSNAGLTPDFIAGGNAKLGIALWGQRQKDKANALWRSVPSAQPEAKAALAAAYAFVGAQDRRPVQMADDAAADARKQGKPLGVRINNHILRVYSRSDAPEKALELLRTSELGGTSYVEVLGKSKSISFYDPGLLGDLAQANLRAAIQYLELARREPKLASTAAYFLVDAYLLAGNTAQALVQAAAFLSQPQIPAPYRVHARAGQAVALYKSGKQQDAGLIWTELTDQFSAQPALLAEVMQACTQAVADCSKFEQRAIASTEAGEGKKYFSLNAALGKYYFVRKEYAKAALYLEAGRDKANKNKIEVNDPTMLASLSQAYFQTKKFSESLEIYFEMSKQYPAVRQIQDALQGIYATEQKSAGDVKIF